MLRRRLCATAALAWVLVGTGAGAEERVVLAPERPPSWRASRALAALREGAREPRALRIETAPPGAALELVYWRGAAAVARARGVAPLRVELPGRALTGEDDRVEVRASLAGRAERSVTLDAQEPPAELHCELSPLPRRLLAASLLELGTHTRLELLSDRALDARLAPTSRGWVLALADVDLGDALAARLEALRATPFSRAEARAAGSDLLLELTRASGEGRAPRLTRREESVRSVVHLALEWLPEDREALALRHARAALSRAAPARVCDAAFEEPLRAALGRESLARSLAPNGSFTDAYVALAIEQLAAESPGGALRLRDGTELRVDGPLALARAAAQASDVDGLLAAVRSVAESLAPEGGVGEALHAWLAPELAPDAFAQVLARADAAQARCRAMR